MSAGSWRGQPSAAGGDGGPRPAGRLPCRPAERWQPSRQRRGARRAYNEANAPPDGQIVHAMEHGYVIHVGSAPALVRCLIRTSAGQTAGRAREPTGYRRWAEAHAPRRDVPPWEVGASRSTLGLCYGRYYDVSCTWR